MHNDHKIKAFHIILSRASAYGNRYDEQTKWMYFLIEDDDLLEKSLFGMKPVMISKDNFLASLFVINIFLKTKIKSHGDEVRGFHDKK